ncbi:MAG: hypothetical protein COB15_09085 [Flavobacteriales bacterium]|nr:MAG: hypothetical protein COB15_09085 [Flavobacteriales bacterium]
MKNLLLILIVLTTTFGCRNDDSQEVDQLKAKKEFASTEGIKAIKSSCYNVIIVGDSVKADKKINGWGFDGNYFKVFNESGNILLEKEYHSNKMVKLKRLYWYDKFQKLIKHIEYDYYGKGSTLIYEYKYNSKDSLIQFTTSFDKFKMIIDNEFDSDNRKTKSTTTNTKNNNIGIVTFDYDIGNNCIKETYYGNAKTYKIVDMVFDKSNNMIEIRRQEYVKNDVDTIDYRHLYEYNSNNMMIKAKTFYKNESTYSSVEYVYDDNGTLLEEKQTPSALMIKNVSSNSVMKSLGLKNHIILITRYDSFGNRTQYLRLYGDGNTKDDWTYNYTYDSKNNWIKKVNYKNDVAISMVKRHILYYDDNQN